MKALITGITGMVGLHLCDFLLENTDWDIYGVCRWRNIKRLYSKKPHYSIQKTHLKKVLTPETLFDIMQTEQMFRTYIRRRI